MPRGNNLARTLKMKTIHPNLKMHLALNVVELSKSLSESFRHVQTQTTCGLMLVTSLTSDGISPGVFFGAESLLERWHQNAERS